ncbi:hypothetical protein [Mycobacterium sp. JS623]|uniref:hypothetical protein n=1 Tax=Mycobacterium sp. JS623 TaxID=212767 RepID=UPI0012FA6C4D|nr:hypothetical protein [Mycobacterium sp. JS623]
MDDRSCGQESRWCARVDHLAQFLNQLDRIGAEVVQEFPDSCVPIAPGKDSADLSALATG